MFVRRLLFACIAFFSSVVWAQVQSVTVSKGVGPFIQTSPTAVSLGSAPNNYSFNADVDGNNISGITPPVLSGPVNAGPQFNNGTLLYSGGDHGWRLGTPNADDFGFSSQAALDAAFGNGTYLFTVNGITLHINLTGDQYPDTPVLTLTGGAWLNGAYVIDPSQPLTVTTTYAGYGSHQDDMMCILIVGGGFPQPFSSVAPYGCTWGTGAVQSHSTSPGSKTLSYTVPANTLTAGTTYTTGAIFNAIVDKTGLLAGSTNNGHYKKHTLATIQAVSGGVPQPTRVFPMDVTSTVTPTTVSVQATLQYRVQDVGRQGSVFVFFVAPSNLVHGSAAALKEARLEVAPKGAKDNTQCVLAQADASGVLHAVSPSTLQPYVTGVLGAQGQAVTVLNNATTANVAGATAFVGYGPDGQTMYDSGVNQSAITITGATVCKPEAPQTGWWWNPLEDGRGYSIEVQANHYFMAAFLYDVSGRATWLVSTSDGATLDGSIIKGQLLSARGGQSLGGAYPGFPTLSMQGPISFAFADSQHGTMVWPGGTVPIERFNIVPNGLNTAPLPSQPENGWWWNADEAGRGFFLEWQGGTLDIAGYMYDDAGNPIWYLTENLTPSTNLQQFSSSWWQFADGMTLAGPWKQNHMVSDHVAPVTITFNGTRDALMTLPNGHTTHLVRQSF